MKTKFFIGKVIRFFATTIEYDPYRSLLPLKTVVCPLIYGFTDLRIYGFTRACACYKARVNSIAPLGMGILGKK